MGYMLVNNLKEPSEEIPDPLEDIGRLSDELQKKDSLLATFKSRLPALSSWLESRQTIELPQHSTTAALRDTVIWEPSPIHLSVALQLYSQQRDPLKASGGSPCGVSSSIGIPLSNKYWALSMIVEPLDQGPDDPEASPRDAVRPLTDTTAFPPLMAACAPPDRRPAPGRPSSGGGSSRTRCSGTLDVLIPRAPDGEDGSTEPAAPLRQHATTLLIGYSIIRNVRLRGAFTLSFPDATVADITEKIPSALNSHPQVNRVVIHVGTNDTPRQQSELLKRDFTQLFNKLSRPQLRVFISGPTLTCGRGIGRFSRLLSLNTWLSSACSSHNVGFVDNFSAFWERRHLFGSDGLHLNRAGTRVLAANLAYDLQHTQLSLSSHHPKRTPTDLSATD
ncbi:unnamed protein product [Xyrichtys novacula]|uniref:Unnamed protein product n=1 Tax=Xyrichtys novacula TaxID=13765 RepID=A0AAV1H5G5_XYRNO|nr:unnamed protein product [Xyrichtys novacula]